MFLSLRYFQGQITYILTNKCQLWNYSYYCFSSNVLEYYFVILSKSNLLLHKSTFYSIIFI